MDVAEIQSDLQRKVGEKVRLLAEGKERFRVLTPFMFDDGDHLAIVLKRQDGDWRFCDEGHTFMHLSYDIDLRDLERGTRGKVVERALGNHGIENIDGELVSAVAGDGFGDALFSFVQGVLHVSDVSYLRKEQVRSTFIEDLKAFVATVAPEERRAFDWSDPDVDPEGRYVIDCRINEMAKPIYIFGVPNDDKCTLATITILYHERAGRPFQSVAVFEEQESINRKVLARLTDVVDKQFSSLPANRDRLATFIRGRLQASADT